ncbi:MAG: cbb3-type cytochrome oxidase assembly protein CcoS [Bacteroidetes bacterium]|nr:cbb3-type cytochrome oxidase assembly protein CcoS [Bacteroidota bacterium]
MKIMFLLILFSITIAAVFLLVYLWAARNGQFDDQYTPSIRMLLDDELRPKDDA